MAAASYACVRSGARLATTSLALSSTFCRQRRPASYALSKGLGSRRGMWRRLCGHSSARPKWSWPGSASGAGPGMPSARDRVEQRGLVLDARLDDRSAADATVTRDQAGEVHHFATCISIPWGLGSWTKCVLRSGGGGAKVTGHARLRRCLIVRVSGVRTDAWESGVGADATPR